jgi:excisionase family DNA binding protein
MLIHFRCGGEMPEPRLRNDLVTLQEAAHQLDVSPRTVRRWVDDGIVEIVQVQRGGRVYLPRVELVRITQRVRKSA